MASGIKVRELFTAWGFDIDAKPLKDMEKQIVSIKSSLKLVLGAVTVAGATLFGFSAFTAHSRIELAKMAQQVGISAEELKELQYAAKFSKTDVDSLQVGLRILSRTAYAASTGSDEAKKSLQAVGVSAVDSQGRLKGTSQLLLEISGRFQKMPEGVKRTALALQVFGRGGAAAIPFLIAGPQRIMALMKESRGFGIIDEQKIEKAERFEHAFLGIGVVLKQIRNAIGDAAMDSFTSGMEQAVTFIRENLPLIKSTISSLIPTFLSGFNAIFGILIGVAGAVVMVVESLGGLKVVLGVLMTLATAFVVGKSVLAIMSLAKAAWYLVASLQAVNGQLLLANLLSGALPLLIGAGGLAADYALRGDRSLVGSVFGGGGAVPAQTFAGSTTSSHSSSTSVAPIINVSVPAASNPQATGQAVGTQVGYELNKLLRQSITDVQSPARR